MLVHRITLAVAGTLIAAAAVTLSVRAEEPPKPSPEIQRITPLAGSFEGHATYTVNGKTVEFTLHHTNRVIAGGFGLAVHEEADLPGLGHYDGESLFGWDAGRKQLHLYSVTTDPATHDHTGSWTDPTHATLRYEGLRDGKKLVEVLPLQVVSANEYHFRSTLTITGQPDEIFEASMKRVDQK